MESQLHSFRDLKGRLWQYALTYDVVRRVRRLTGLDLFDYEGVLAKIKDDTESLVNLLFAAADPGPGSAGVSDEEFATGLDGAVIDEATHAFLDAWVAFFRPDQRAVVTQLVKAGRMLAEKASAMAVSTVNGIDWDRWADSELRRTTKTPSSGAQESAESTPVP